MWRQVRGTVQLLGTSDEVDFLHADKHQNFLQVDTIFFDWLGQVCPKYMGIIFTISQGRS